MSAKCHLHLNNFHASTETQELFHNITISLAAGSLLHIHGANGSGKSTLLRMIAGLKYHEGQLYWEDDEQKSVNIEKELFYLGHQPAIKMNLTVTENIHYLHSLHDGDLNNIQDILKMIELHRQSHHLAQNLSQGQQQRLALTPLLWSSQKLWLLDEPFVALDSTAKKWLSHLLNHHLEQKGWAILASHEKIDFIQHPTEHLFLGAADV